MHLFGLELQNAGLFRLLAEALSRNGFLIFGCFDHDRKHQLHPEVDLILRFWSAEIFELLPKNIRQKHTLCSNSKIQNSLLSLSKKQRHSSVVRVIALFPTAAIRWQGCVNDSLIRDFLEKRGICSSSSQYAKPASTNLPSNEPRRALPQRTRAIMAQARERHPQILHLRHRLVPISSGLLVADSLFWITFFVRHALHVSRLFWAIFSPISKCGW